MFEVIDGRFGVSRRGKILWSSWEHSARFPHISKVCAVHDSLASSSQIIATAGQASSVEQMLEKTVKLSKAIREKSRTSGLAEIDKEMIKVTAFTDISYFL